MGSRPSAPDPQEKRFAAYMEGLAIAAGHEDRHLPFKSYCKGLLLPGERKSIEPMAARIDPDNVQQMRQSLHHLIAKAPWSDEPSWNRCAVEHFGGIAPSGRRHRKSGVKKRKQIEIEQARRFSRPVVKQKNGSSLIPGDGEINRSFANAITNSPNHGPHRPNPIH